MHHVVQTLFASLLALGSLTNVRQLCQRLFPQRHADSSAVLPARTFGALDHLVHDPAEQVDDLQEQFTAWEQARAEELQQADAYEAQGLRLLGKAVLLRTAVQLDDADDFYLATDLRERANGSAVKDQAAKELLVVEAEPTFAGKAEHG